MSAICLIDTCIFTNILDVPGRNQKQETISKDFQEYTELGCLFILPMATILETGNHIAQNGDGNLRRQTAKRFVEALNDSFSEEPPWILGLPLEADEIQKWLSEFPDHAGKNKSAKKTGEGTSFGDLSIIKEYNHQCNLHKLREIFIWSLDSDLKCHHQNPKI